MNFAAIRSALAANAATIVSSPPLITYAYVPESIVPPALFVMPNQGTFDLTFGRGFDEAEFVLRLCVSRADDLSGQALLDGYLAGSGATSVKAAVQSDLTLGGAAQTLRVTGWDSYGQHEIGGVLYIGCEFAVVVTARGA